jgi:hypothetical protein
MKTFWHQGEKKAKKKLCEKMRKEIEISKRQNKKRHVIPVYLLDKSICKLNNKRNSFA